MYSPRSQAASQYHLSTYRRSGIRHEGSGPNRHVKGAARVERLVTVLIRRAFIGEWDPLEYMYRPLFGYSAQPIRQQQEQESTFLNLRTVYAVAAAFLSNRLPVMLSTCRSSSSSAEEYGVQL